MVHLRDGRGLPLEFGGVGRIRVCFSSFLALRRRRLRYWRTKGFGSALALGCLKVKTRVSELKYHGSTLWFTAGRSGGGAGEA